MPSGRFEELAIGQDPVRIYTNLVSDRPAGSMSSFLWSGVVVYHPWWGLNDDVLAYADRIAEPSRRMFAASITHMDAAIGRIVAALDRAGLRKNTFILFTSDNGGQQNGGDSWKSDYGGKFGASPVLGDNRPLRGWKGDLYDGGIRVPAFVNWPGTLEPRVVNEPVSVLDWLPTISGLVGFETNPEMRLEGQDVWPLLRGAAAAGSRTLYWKTPKQWAVIVGGWKLIETAGKKPTHELFDLASDPYEKHDLAADRPEQVARLLETLRVQQSRDPAARPRSEPASI